MLLFTLLGHLCFMVLLLNFSQKEMAMLFTEWQESLWTKSLDVSFKKMLLRSLALVLTEASPRRTQMTGLALYNLRILGKRSSLLLMALSNLGAWWVLLLSLLFMNVSVVYIIGIALVPALIFRNTVWVRRLFLVLVASALFLSQSELMIRNASSLLATVGESDFVFWLIDGRLPAVLGLMLAAVVLTFIIPLEFWSVCVSLALLFSSLISFNGAIALFAGERIARGILFIWAGRNLNQDCRLTTRQQGGAAAVAAVLGLFILLYTREVTDLGRSFGMSEAQDRLFDFSFALVVILFTQFLAQMIAGHFAALKSVDEFQDIHYFPSSWLTSGILSKSATDWSRQQISKRVQEIRYHIQGLTTYKEGQIPEHVQIRLKKEEEELSRLLKS